jgi:AcrR family transcriptional regulator
VKYTVRTVYFTHDPCSGSLNQVVGGERDERRAQLVRSAFDRVAEVGFEGLRLRQVAEAVGIDHSTLHHHFATKQHLVEAVSEYASRQFWAAGAGHDDPADALRAHLADLRALLDGRPELFVVTVELDLRARRDPAVAAAMHRHQVGWSRFLVEVLEAGNARGSWGRQLDPEGISELVIAVVRGVRLSPATAGPAFAQLVDLLIPRGGERA